MSSSSSAGEMSGRTAPMRTSSTRVVSSVVPGCTPISRSCRQSSGRVIAKAFVECGPPRRRTPDYRAAALQRARQGAMASTWITRCTSSLTNGSPKVAPKLAALEVGRRSRRRRPRACSVSSCRHAKDVAHQRQRLADAAQRELAAHFLDAAGGVELEARRDEIRLGVFGRRQQVGLLQARVEHAHAGARRVAIGNAQPQVARLAPRGRPSPRPSIGPMRPRSVDVPKCRTSNVTKVWFGSSR